MSGFRVAIPNYEGPLDLLVDLIRAHELKVLDLQLSEIAEAFVFFMSGSHEDLLEEAGEFVLLLATLLELKSRELVPRPMEEAVEADAERSRTEVVRQLLEYRRYKEAAAVIAERAEERSKRLPRGAPELGRAVDPSKQPIREVELWDLVSAFSRIMRENIVPALDHLPRDPTPLATYMDRIEAAVSAADSGIGLAELLGNRNQKVQLIGKFLAVLELVKAGRIWLEMDRAEGEIKVFPRRLSSADQSEQDVMADETRPPEFETGLAGSSTPARASEGTPTPNWTQSGTDSEPPESKRSAWDGYEPLAP